MNKKQRFVDKTAVVTGSTRGIGAEIARRIASEGGSVVVCGRSADEGESVCEEISSTDGESVFVAADVRNEGDIEAVIDTAVEEFGGLNVLVNNAAIQTATKAQDVSLSEWEQVVETDFRGYWLCAKYAYDVIETGSIVNVSSNHSSVTMPSIFPYNAVKSGIDGLSRAMALDFGPEIRVNSVNPGWVAVRRTVDGMSEGRRNELASIHPVGRIGQPEDVAAAVAYLASDEASFVTGTTLTVDGGRSAVMQDDVLPDYRTQDE